MIEVGAEAIAQEKRPIDTNHDDKQIIFKISAREENKVTKIDHR